MRPIFAIEIGNSSIGCAYFDDRRIVTHFYIESNTHDTAQEYCRIFAKNLRAVKIDADSITAVFMASVVPSLTETIAQAAQLLTAGSGAGGRTKRAPLIINGHSRLNITVRSENKDELGSDIILNLDEAWERNGRRASVVVDFGTAVTVSAVDDNGTVCGVSIAPGVTTAMKSLTAATAQLPPVPLQFPPQVMGRDTVSALQSGILYGYCGLVGELVSAFQRELRSRHEYQMEAEAAQESRRRGEERRGDTDDSNAPVPRQSPVIATGGDGAVMWSHIPQVNTYARELTLCGLYRLGQLNSESKKDSLSNN